MKLEKTYLIKKGEWTNWSETIAESTRDFYNVYTFYPNILEANDFTFSQFDFLTNVNPDERQHVASKNDVTGEIKFPEETENILLSSFNFCDEADIDFAVNNQLADKEIRLIYDDEPEWDEPEIQGNCPEDEIEKESKIYTRI